MRLLFISLAFIVVASDLFGQDPEIVQYQQNNLLFNPAYSGNDSCHRVASSHRIQSFRNYFTHTVSYDQPLSLLHGGLGISVMHDEVGSNKLRTIRFMGAYAYHASLTGKLSISAAIEASYFQKELDWSNLTFGDMIDPRRGFIYETQDTPRGGTIQNVDFGTGVILFTNKFHLGFAAHHLNEPNESLVVGLRRLPMKLTIHGGAKLPIKTSIKGDEIVSISPSFLFRQQAEFKQMNLGLFLNIGPLFGGVWYRGMAFTEYRDALIAVVGIETDIMRFGYSYDMTISELTPATDAGHEISLAFFIKSKKIKPKRRIITNIQQFQVDENNAIKGTKSMGNEIHPNNITVSVPSENSNNIIFNAFERDSPIERIFVVAIASEDCSGNIQDGQDIASLTETLLLGDYDILERRYFEEILDEQKLAASGLLFEESAVELGCNAGSQGIIFTEVGCISGEETINLKLVGCQTSEIYWSCMGIGVMPLETILKVKEELSK